MAKKVKLTALQKRQIAFLDDLVKYYSVPGRRAVRTNGTCRYLTEDGRKCAIGRHIIKEKYSHDLEGFGVTNTRVLGSLPKKILNLTGEFLNDCQKFHDDGKAWDAQGLTESGKEFYNYILNGIHIGRYTVEYVVINGNIISP